MLLNAVSVALYVLALLSFEEPWCIWLIAVAGGLGKSNAAAQGALSKLPLPESGPGDLRSLLQRNNTATFFASCCGNLLAGALYSWKGYMAIVLVAAFASSLALVQELFVVGVLANNALKKKRSGGEVKQDGKEHGQKAALRGQTEAGKQLMVNLKKQDTKWRNDIAYTMVISFFVYGALVTIFFTVIPLQFTSVFGVDPAVPALLVSAGEIASVIVMQFLQHRHITTGPILSAKSLAVIAFVYIMLMFSNIYIFSVCLVLIVIALNLYFTSLFDQLSHYADSEKFSQFAAVADICTLMAGVVFSLVGSALWHWNMGAPFAFCAILALFWLTYCISQILKRSLFLTSTQDQITDDKLVSRFVKKVGDDSSALSGFFTACDADETGDVDVSGLSTQMRKIDAHGCWTTPDCHRLMRVIDDDANGKMSFGELQNFIVSDKAAASSRTTLKKTSVISMEKSLDQVGA
jgi:hypothetical protein